MTGFPANYFSGSSPMQQTPTPTAPAQRPATVPASILDTLSSDSNMQILLVVVVLVAAAAMMNRGA